MLRVVFTDTAGREHLFFRPLSMTIRMDENVPADDFSGVFAYSGVGELAGVCIYDDEKKVFAGIVDEQESILSPDGRVLRVCARSLAAHLLDNEAMPQSYDHPSASLIYERHIKPYGIAWQDSDDATFFGELAVTKGMSQWTVLKSFCSACYSSSPRVTADGKLRMKGAGSEQTVIFSDGAGGIAYTELRECRKRCEEISRVNIKVSDDAGYRYLLDNSGAISRGIRRERYLNAVLEKTPMTCADAMLANAAAASYEVRLVCPDRLLYSVGCGARVINRTTGVLDDLYISAVSYRMDADGEKTTLLLRRRNNGCGYQDI